MSLNLTGNNLIPYPYTHTTKTVNGLTFTDNGDGTISVNGTATATTGFTLRGINSTIITKGEKYYISGSPIPDKKDIFVVVNFYNKTASGTTWVYATRSDAVVDTSTVTKEWNNTTIEITVVKGYTCNNLLVKPMLNKGTTALPYEPYKSINPENIKVNTGTETKDVEKVVVAKSPNLVVYPYPYPSLNDNGIAFTTNDNGEIIANGTIEDNAKHSQFSLNENSKIFNIQKDIYTMSCPMSLNDNTHTATFLLDFYLDGVWKFTHSVNNTNNLTKTIDLRDKEFNQVYGYVRILKEDTGTFEDFTFKPMLNKGDKALPYQKYDREVVWSKTSTTDETTDEETTISDEIQQEETTINEVME